MQFYCVHYIQASETYRGWYKRWLRTNHDKFLMHDHIRHKTILVEMRIIHPKTNINARIPMVCQINENHGHWLLTRIYVAYSFNFTYLCFAWLKFLSIGFSETTNSSCKSNIWPYLNILRLYDDMHRTQNEYTR